MTKTATSVSRKGNRIMTDIPLLTINGATEINYVNESFEGGNFTEGDNWNHPQEYYYIYDIVYIRVLFISLYTIVFCLCFFGKSRLCYF